MPEGFRSPTGSHVTFDSENGLQSPAPSITGGQPPGTATQEVLEVLREMLSSERKERQREQSNVWDRVDAKIGVCVENHATILKAVSGIESRMSTVEGGLQDVVYSLPDDFTVGEPLVESKGDIFGESYKHASTPEGQMKGGLSEIKSLFSKSVVGQTGEGVTNRLVDLIVREAMDRIKVEFLQFRDDLIKLLEHMHSVCNQMQSGSANDGVPLPSDKLRQDVDKLRNQFREDLAARDIGLARVAQTVKEQGTALERLGFMSQATHEAVGACSIKVAKVHETVRSSSPLRSERAPSSLASRDTSVDCGRNSPPAPHVFPDVARRTTGRPMGAPPEDSPPAPPADRWDPHPQDAAPSFSAAELARFSTVEPPNTAPRVSPSPSSYSQLSPARNGSVRTPRGPLLKAPAPQDMLSNTGASNVSSGSHHSNKGTVQERLQRLQQSQTYSFPAPSQPPPQLSSAATSRNRSPPTPWSQLPAQSASITASSDPPEQDALSSTSASNPTSSPFSGPRAMTPQLQQPRAGGARFTGSAGVLAAASPGSRSATPQLQQPAPCTTPTPKSSSGTPQVVPSSAISDTLQRPSRSAATSVGSSRNMSPLRYVPGAQSQARPGTPQVVPSSAMQVPTSLTSPKALNPVPVTADMSRWRVARTASRGNLL